MVQDLDEGLMRERRMNQGRERQIEGWKDALQVDEG